MRTLSTTFSNRDEAEAASRRLEAIGIGRERIVMRDVAAVGDGPATGAGGVFVSVKVTTDQVQPASDILRSLGAAAEAPAPSPRPAVAPPAVQAALQPDLPPRPLPAATPPAQPFAPAPAAAYAPIPAPVADSQPPPRPATEAASSRRERDKLVRNLIYYGLALLGAFMIGAWLGMLD